MIELTTLLV